VRPPPWRRATATNDTIARATAGIALLAAHTVYIYVRGGVRGVVGGSGSLEALFSSSGVLLRLRCDGHGRSVVPLPPMPMLLRLRGGERARARKLVSKYIQPNIEPAGDQANNSLTRKESSSGGATEASAGHIASAALLPCCSVLLD
jgi:hypothetical protein